MWSMPRLVHCLADLVYLNAITRSKSLACLSHEASGRRVPCGPCHEAGGRRVPCSPGHALFIAWQILFI